MATKYLNDGFVTLLKKDTAGVIVYQVGTAENQTILASKNGGNFAAVNAGTTETALTGGDSTVLYKLAVNAADTATLGPLVFESKGATDTTYVWAYVVAELPGMVAASGIPVGAFVADSITAAALAADAGTELATAAAAAILVTPANKVASDATGRVDLGTDSVDADALNTDAVTEIVAAVAAFDNAVYEATGDTGTTLGAMIAAIRAGMVGRLALSGTTLTIYEVDGVTVMGTHTLDSATMPRTRTGLA